MVSMILRPYIHNPYGINDIKVSMILRPIFTIQQPTCHDIKVSIWYIKALYSQPIWYQ